jgi:hypothetical protein
MTYISILLHDYIRYVWSLEVLDALSEHKPCLNTMFKQAATEPWMANWRRWHMIQIRKSEHIELLSFNTLYIT